MSNPHVSECFGKPSFSSVLGSRPDGDVPFGRQKRSLSKTLSRADLFEYTVFLFSCGRVTTELFKNNDVTPSICYISEHALCSLRITRRQFAYFFLLSKFECRIWLSNIELLYRISSFECRSVSCRPGSS